MVAFSSKKGTHRDSAKDISRAMPQEPESDRAKNNPNH
jgi:hypothetical protein